MLLDGVVVALYEVVVTAADYHLAITELTLGYSAFLALVYHCVLVVLAIVFPMNHTGTYEERLRLKGSFFKELLQSFLLAVHSVLACRASGLLPLISSELSSMWSSWNDAYSLEGYYTTFPCLLGLVIPIVLGISLQSLGIYYFVGAMLVKIALRASGHLALRPFSAESPRTQLMSLGCSVIVFLVVQHDLNIDHVLRHMSHRSQIVWFSLIIVLGVMHHFDAFYRRSQRRSTVERNEAVEAFIRESSGWKSAFFVLFPFFEDARSAENSQVRQSSRRNREKLRWDDADVTDDDLIETGYDGNVTPTRQDSSPKKISKKQEVSHQPFLHMPCSQSDANIQSSVMNHSSQTDTQKSALEVDSLQFQNPSLNNFRNEALPASHFLSQEASQPDDPLGLRILRSIPFLRGYFLATSGVSQPNFFFSETSGMIGKAPDSMTSQVNSSTSFDISNPVITSTVNNLSPTSNPNINNSNNTIANPHHPQQNVNYNTQKKTISLHLTPNDSICSSGSESSTYGSSYAPSSTSFASQQQNNSPSKQFFSEQSPAFSTASNLSAPRDDQVRSWKTKNLQVDQITSLNLSLSDNPENAFANGFQNNATRLYEPVNKRNLRRQPSAVSLDKNHVFRERVFLGTLRSLCLGVIGVEVYGETWQEALFLMCVLGFLCGLFLYLKEPPHFGPVCMEGWRRWGAELALRGDQKNQRKDNWVEMRNGMLLV
eukprot:GDKJ01014781.1.p1 GENE.GDKJ01014781.1~~GDKJ01014781.1.p1  ORF type:complete len:714 (-),score=128.19 GDKJ01014781.1:80-2221(-)